VREQCSLGACKITSLRVQWFTICATLVDPKLDVYISAPVTLKSRSNHRWICQFVGTC